MSIEVQKELLFYLLPAAERHVKRLKYALSRLRRKYPITAEQVMAMEEENRELLLWELLTSRFAKLQDLLGNKIFSACLIASGENVESWTMIDKLNKLQKLGIIGDVDFWLEKRTLRNHLSYEYPMHPEITARYLNQTFECVPELFAILEKIKAVLVLHNIPPLTKRKINAKDGGGK